MPQERSFVGGEKEMSENNAATAAILQSLDFLKAGQSRLELVLRDGLREQKTDQQALWDRQWKENDSLWAAIKVLQSIVDKAQGGVAVGRIALVATGTLFGFLVSLSLKFFWGH